VHGGDLLARAGEVLALVPQHPSAGPGQDQGLRGLVKPHELAGSIPVGRTGVLDRTRVTYSDALQFVLAEAPASQPAEPELPKVHVSTSRCWGL
jgi:hypothetical protein